MAKLGLTLAVARTRGASGAVDQSRKTSNGQNIATASTTEAPTITFIRMPIMEHCSIARTMDVYVIEAGPLRQLICISAGVQAVS